MKSVYLETSDKIFLFNPILPRIPKGDVRLANLSVRVPESQKVKMVG